MKRSFKVFTVLLLLFMLIFLSSAVLAEEKNTQKAAEIEAAEIIADAIKKQTTAIIFCSWMISIAITLIFIMK